MIDDIKTSLVKLARYYEKTLPDDLLIAFAKELSRDLSDIEMSQACSLYTSNPQNEFFPRPMAKLVQLIRKPITNEDAGQNVTSLLLEAERKHGIHWADGHYQNMEQIFDGKDSSYRTWEDAALSEFGEVGLTLVKRYGGWKQFCQNLYDSPDGVVRAQVKNLAISLQNIKQKTGSFDALPSNENNLLQFTKIKTIGGKSDK